MKILVYEFVTGGGLWPDDSLARVNRPLWAEASAMVQALAADLNQMPGTTVVRLQDTRLDGLMETDSEILPVNSAEQESHQLATGSAMADGTILIAPEIHGQLAARCQLVEQAGGQLLSPHLDFVRLASDKQQMAHRLSQAQIPTPAACQLADNERLPTTFPYPAILKPNDGVGSLQTQLVRHPQEVNAALRPSGPARLEQFHAGTPASIAALCGPAGNRLLPACQQRISFHDGAVHYLGGRVPLASTLSRRAEDLAQAVLTALPATRGFVGIDLILGADKHGDHDVVLEVNPRLTTSYVGLRQACRSNLAAAMIRIAQGDRYPLSFHANPIRFDTDGRWRYESMGYLQP